MFFIPPFLHHQLPLFAQLRTCTPPAGHIGALQPEGQ